MATKRKKSEDSKWSVTRGSGDPGEEVAKEAIDVLSAHYHSSIRYHAKEIVKEIKSGEIESREALEERLHQDVDGSSWVIYTFWSKVCLLVSRHDDAYEEEFGDKPEGPAQAAFAAYTRDLTEQIESEADGDVDALFDRDEDDED